MRLDEMLKAKESGKCPFCGKDMTIDANKSFKDDRSLKEYEISGLCQDCQDDFFGGK